jgi:hypothetical protein
MRSSRPAIQFPAANSAFSTGCGAFSGRMQELDEHGDWAAGHAVRGWAPPSSKRRSHACRRSNRSERLVPGADSMFSNLCGAFSGRGVGRTATSFAAPASAKTRTKSVDMTANSGSGFGKSEQLQMKPFHFYNPEDDIRPRRLSIREPLPPRRPYAHARLHVCSHSASRSRDFIWNITRT